MKKFLLFSIIIFLTPFCFSKNISVQIIQNNPGQDKIWVTTELFEQYVIDCFFDNGQIISNSPIWISSSDSKNRGALRAALRENAIGGMDYLVRIEIFFKTGKNFAPDFPLLENIDKVSWKVYSVSTGLEEANGSGIPEKITDDNNNEVGISSFAHFITKKINSKIEG